MKKTLVTITLSGGMTLSSFAQQAIGTAGGRYENGSAIIEYNIGEAVIGTVSNNGTTLTQGFEQPWVEISTLVAASEPGEEVLIYPNPARHFLNIKQESGLARSYAMVDARGREVLAGSLTGILTELDTEKLAGGSYVLRINTINNTPEQAFRIIIAH